MTAQPAPAPADRTAAGAAVVELHWIPLGAGAHVVRLSGWLYERLSALVQRRRPLDLYHSALVVRVPEGAYVIEMTPVPRRAAATEGVVVVGPVGTRWAGRFRLFRYEVGCRCDGVIADRASERSGPVEVTRDVAQARRILALAASVPARTWGRDEIRAGDMWNSNSVTAWLLVAAGVDLAVVGPPDGGRAPGWLAGLVAADRAVTGGVPVPRPAATGRCRS